MRNIIVFLLIALSITACNLPGAATPTLPPTNTNTSIPSETPTPTETITPTQTPTDTPTVTPTHTETLVPSETPTITMTFSQTISPTPTETMTLTPTSTPEGVTGTALLNAYCRLGPGTAYITSGVTFFEGTVAAVDGKFGSSEGQWFWIQIPDVAWHCWVHSSTLELSADHSQVKYVSLVIPTNDSVAPPTGISASRNGKQVTVTWSAAAPALELGYVLEGVFCDGTFAFFYALQTTNTAITVTDADNCGQTSYATLRVVNKLGYSNSVTVFWP